MEAILMTPDFRIFILFPIVFGLMAAFFLVIGLRGWISNKPFVISSRWLLVLVLLAMSPGLSQFVERARPVGEPGALAALHWLLPIMLFVVLIFACFALRGGYTAFGITDASFREALLYSFNKLGLPYEETLSAIRLPTQGADLQVAVQSWVGTAQLKMKEREFGAVLKDIVNGMNEYYQSGTVAKVNLTCCIFFTIIGIFLAVFAGIFLFGFGRIF